MTLTQAEVFDQLRHVRPDGSEYWSARDLQGLLGYAKWENFQTAITRAIEACENSEQPSTDHFPAARKMVEIGSSTRRDVLDYHLTRYAAYLTAMNSDPAKGAVALAQTYFTAQTRAAEIQQARAASDDLDPVLAQLAALASVRRDQLNMQRTLDSQARELAQVRQQLDNTPVAMFPALEGRLKAKCQELGKLMPGQYPAAYRALKAQFGQSGAPLARYNSLPARQFEDAMRFLDGLIVSYRGGYLLGGDQA